MYIAPLIHLGLPFPDASATPVSSYISCQQLHFISCQQLHFITCQQLHFLSTVTFPPSAETQIDDKLYCDTAATDIRFKICLCILCQTNHNVDCSAPLVESTSMYQTRRWILPAFTFSVLIVRISRNLRPKRDARIAATEMQG